MGKKLKALAGGLSESQLATTVKESAQQIWLAGLGAFAKAQAEGSKVFDALVKEGETIQSRTRQMTDEKISQVAGKAAGTWDRLEQVFEDRVARSLGSLGVPSKKDIDKLSKRVVELTAVVHALTEAQAKAAAVVAEKPAARKAAAEPAAAPVSATAAATPAKPEVKAAAVKPAPKPAVKKAPVKAAAKPVAKPAVKAAVKMAVKPAETKAVTPADVLKGIAGSNS